MFLSKLSRKDTKTSQKFRKGHISLEKTGIWISNKKK